MAFNIEGSSNCSSVMTPQIPLFDECKIVQTLYGKLNYYSIATPQWSCLCKKWLMWKIVEGINSLFTKD